MISLCKERHLTIHLLSDILIPTVSLDRFPLQLEILDSSRLCTTHHAHSRMRSLFWPNFSFGCEIRELFANDLSGSIPSSIGNLKNLKHLYSELLLSPRFPTFRKRWRYSKVKTQVSFPKQSHRIHSIICWESRESHRFVKHPKLLQHSKIKDQTRCTLLIPFPLFQPVSSTTTIFRELFLPQLETWRVSFNCIFQFLWSFELLIFTEKTTSSPPLSLIDWLWSLVLLEKNQRFYWEQPLGIDPFFDWTFKKSSIPVFIISSFFLEFHITFASRDLSIGLRRRDCWRWCQKLGDSFPTISLDQFLRRLETWQNSNLCNHYLTLSLLCLSIAFLTFDWVIVLRYLNNNQLSGDLPPFLQTQPPYPLSEITLQYNQFCCPAPSWCSSGICSGCGKRLFHIWSFKQLSHWFLFSFMLLRERERKEVCSLEPLWIQVRSL